VAELKTDLANGRTGILLAQSVKTLAKADVGQLGDGAAWNLGTLFDQSGRQAEAELLWKRSFAGEGTPWKEAAGRDLFDLYAARRDWPKAEAVAQRLSSFDSSRPEFQRRLFEAYYFQKQDDRAWAIFRTWKPGQFSPEEELENRLFFGVLSARGGKTDDAASTLSDLVFNREASVLQFRLESFFQEDESRYELLGPGGREAVAFQSLVYRGVSKDVQAWFKGRKFPQGFWNRRALIAGIEAVFKTSQPEVGLRILEGLRAGVTGEAKFALEYARGRLYRTLGWWPQARAAFQTAQALASAPDDHKKTAWNWLNAWVNLHPEGSLGPFLQVYAGTDDPSYFTDVFTAWITELVQGRQWDLLAAIWRDLAHRLDSEDRAMVAFILSRLASHGLVDLPREGIEDTPAALLEQVIAWEPFSYEGLVARAVLGKPLEWPETGPLPEFRSDDRSREQVRLWESMLPFGLGRTVANQVVASAAPLDVGFVDRAVAFLQSHDQYRPSLQLLYRLLREPGRVLTRDVAARLYPVGYRELVTASAETEELEVSLLLGLIREESTFDPDARSWVGAQGLTQLMPATAAETAKRLKMKTYDLASPADNVKLGARYLSTMIRSQGQIYLALMAYNAGGGRIRPWKEAMGRLPEEIFVEAAPLSETRGYVKKILTSTVMTGVLHYNKTLDEMVRLIYPGFEP
jgi:hypothetical protein